MIALILCSLMYVCLLTIIFFSKKRLVSVENKLFKILMVLNIWGLSIELMCFYTVKNMNAFPLLNTIITKMLLVYYFVWNLYFTFYVVSVVLDAKGKNNETKQKVLDKLFKIGYLIIAGFVLIIFKLPMNYVNLEGKIYSYGKSVDLTNLTFIIAMGIWIILLLFSYKNRKNKKHIPIYFFIMLGSVLGVIQHLNPWLTIMTSFETLVVFLMFFTIENPDLQMLYELKKNRDLIDKNIEEKSNFLFSVSQDLRMPIHEMEKIIKNTDKSSLKILNEDMQRVNQNVKELSFNVNKLLNISQIESANIKKYDNYYNINNLFKNLELKVKNEVNKNVECHFHIPVNLPDKVYGDEILIKQILNTILGNAIKYTNKGFIELNCNTIIKYDICRFIISVEDSGKGMSSDEINALISDSEEISEKELKLLDEKYLNISLINKLVKYLGGSLLVKSDPDIGSKFTLVFEQRISHEGNSNSFQSIILNRKKVLIISDDSPLLNKLKCEFEKQDCDTFTTMYGMDAVLKIRNGEMFDLIVIEDDMKLLSGYNTKKELDNYNVDIPIIMVMANPNEQIEKSLINDGFTDVMYAKNPDVKAICDKYL